MAAVATAVLVGPALTQAEVGAAVALPVVLVAMLLRTAVPWPPCLR